MKVIISHDVDHITATEHLTDTIIPKFIVRNNIEWFIGKISFNEKLKRLSNIFKNKWQNINEIIVFNQKQDVPATFFVGVDNGVGLNYSIDLAEKWIKEIIKQGVDCGVHGIKYQTSNQVQQEYDLFKQISGLDSFGIRMHYLRNDKATFEHLAKAGYIFDTTDYGIKQHYKIGEMYEFPLHIMESYELENGKKWQSQTVEQAVKSTISKIKSAEKQGVEYLTILFHDRYYDESFLSWKKWYEDIVLYCKSEGYLFVNYREAIDILTSEENKFIKN